MPVRFFWIKWLYNFALEPLAKFLAFFLGKEENGIRETMRACNLQLVLCSCELFFLVSFSLFSLSFFYVSHLSTAVLSVYTHTHAPSYTRTPYVYNQTYNRYEDHVLREITGTIKAP